MNPAASSRVLVLLLGTLGSCGSSQAPQASAPDSGTGIELFVDPHRSLYIEPNMPIGELLERYTERMGWTLLASTPMRAKLAARRCEFTQRLEVPFESVHEFVEALVRGSGLYLRFEHKGVPIVLQVIDPEDKEQGDIPAHRVLVPLTELPRWEAHPAHMITAQVPLPAGDADALVKSLRAVFGEAARGQVIRTGDANAVLLSGTGAEVARLARVLAESTRSPGSTDAQLPAPAERPKYIELLHAPSKGLHLEQPGNGELTLMDVVEQYAQLMGWRLLFGPDARNQLRALNCGIALPVDVPAEHVHAFVEGILFANDFLLNFAHAREPVLLEVQTRDLAGPNFPRRDAHIIDAVELPRWSEHPAFLVTTFIDFPGVDTRTLPNTLRTLFSDQQTQQILQVGSNGLIVTGPGSEAAALATLFHTLCDGAGGADAPPAAVPARARLLDLLVPPALPLRIPKPDFGVPTLQAFVDAYAGLMGWHLLEAPDTRNQLRTLKCGFDLPIEVAPDHVHAFVESVMKTNDYILDFANAKDPVLLRVESTSVAGRGYAHAAAHFVPATELAGWAAHPDFLITTCLDLPGVDVRTLSNSLRQMFSDQQKQQIVPAGNTDGLIVTGFGSEVSDIATILLSLSAAAAGTHVPLPAMSNTASGIDLLVTPLKGLHFEKPERHELKLIDMFDQYAQLMGWHLLVNPDTRNQLVSLNCAFSLPLDVSPENVHTFVEGVARENEFVLNFAHAREPVLLAVASTNVAGKGNPRKDATVVPASELARWAAHPDFLITTCIELSGVDVRTLSNSLRQMFSDQQTQQIIPVGNTDGLIVTGFGSDVSKLTSMLLSISAAAAGTHAPPPAMPNEASGIDLFVPPPKGMRLEAPEPHGLRLIDLFEQYAQLMGWHLLVGPDTRNQLMTMKCAFSLPLDVPPERVHAFIEGVARAEKFVISFAHVQEPVLLEITSATIAGKGNPRADAQIIPCAELPRWAAHPAFLITTCIDLPGVDVRTLSNSLRQVFSDQMTQQIIPVGNSDGLVLTGFGSDIAMLAASLGELGRGGAGLQLRALPVALATDRARLFPLGGTSFSIPAPDGKEAAPIDVLEEFASWTKRPLEISDEARKALVAVERKFAEPRLVPTQLAYPCVGLLLERARCTLSPVPSAAPEKWVVDVARNGKAPSLPDLPTVRFEELAAWNAYCATPFRTLLKLPEGADPKQVEVFLKTIAVGEVGCRMALQGNGSLLLCGTPLEIQATAYAILDACAPAATGR